MKREKEKERGGEIDVSRRAKRNYYPRRGNIPSHGKILARSASASFASSSPAINRRGRESWQAGFRSFRDRAVAFPLGGGKRLNFLRVQLALIAY